MLEITARRAAASWRMALFGCALALCLAMGVLHPPGASALGEQCSGGKVKGMGSFLQTLFAQS